MENNVRLPEDFKEFDGEEIMSNFDGKVVEETAEAIKGKPLFSRYPGLNFHGKVWWNTTTSKWCCEVWCYGSYRKTVIENDLEDIINTVSDEFGRD